MKFSSSLCAFLSLSFTPLSVKATGYECLLFQLDALFPDGGHGNGNSPIDDNEGWRCVLNDSDSSAYSIEGLPQGFFRNNLDLISGETILSVSSGRKFKADGSRKNTLGVAPGALVSAARSNGRNPNKSLRQRGGRELVMKEGNPTVLVIRVSGLDDAPPQDANTLSDDIFGTFGDLVNMVRSMERVDN
jgi:hypothetical protein